MRHAVRVGPNLMGLRLFREADMALGNVGVGRFEYGQVIGISPSNAFCKIRSELHNAVLVAACATQQRNATRGKISKVDRVTASSTAHGDRDVLRAWRDNLRIPLA